MYEYLICAGLLELWLTVFSGENIPIRNKGEYRGRHYRKSKEKDGVGSSHYTAYGHHWEESAEQNIVCTVNVSQLFNHVVLILLVCDC